MINTEKELYSEMKKNIQNKTECMIDSYAEVLKNTRRIISDITGSDDPAEVMKRADMFWNIALQRIDKEQEVVTSQMMPSRRDMSARTGGSVAPIMGRGKTSRETPCAKKARESAEKIATLEAEIVEQKGK